MEYLENIKFNSILIISYFILSFIALILNKVTKGKTNKILFSSYRSSLLNPLTYIRFFTHSIGHISWEHFSNNFIYILLIGPMIEEKYGTINLLVMFLVTSFLTGVFNSVTSKNIILGASGNVYMLIVLSSFVNIESGKIPFTLILISFFFIINEIIAVVSKKDGISHTSHLIGALIGCILGFSLQ